MGIGKLVRRAVQSLGYDVVKYQPPGDFTPEEVAIVRRIKPFTMTSVERQVALIQAVRYLVQRGIEGDFVECGVWRGGSSMAMALTLMDLKRTDRDLYLYDTFQGMTPPEAVDRTNDGATAQSHLESDVKKEVFWCIASKDDVQKNLASTGYPKERLHYIEGPVEVTLPKAKPPGQIALLRLDTDWYESTSQEMIHLFPKVATGGIVLVDDYGYWQGARRAIDEHLARLPRIPYLHRIDEAGRLFIKE